MPQINISIDGVTKLLRNLNPHKATGPDEIPAKILKDAAEDLAPALTLFYQASVNQGSLPADWRKYLFLKRATVARQPTIDQFP